MTFDKRFDGCLEQHPEEVVTKNQHDFLNHQVQQARQNACMYPTASQCAPKRPAWVRPTLAIAAYLALLAAATLICVAIVQCRA
jgi:hypothetical protein